ncbi:LysM peptidoglycan-binding domain-containing protein [Ramlibacter albus]
MAQTKAGLGWIGVACAVLAVAASAVAQPVSPAQRSTAQQVAQSGVPLSELAPNAPDSYTVKRGDTLWAIAGIFLKSPWRWPELWGMNMNEVRNPHRIYPGQQLFLDKVGGMARLRMGPGGADGPVETVRVSPRTRVLPVGDTSIPTLAPHLIEPFLDEPIILERSEFDQAPRIISATDNRVLMTRGDRAYVRGRTGTPFVETDPTKTELFRVFREATPLKEPGTNRILGYEAQYLGGARLMRSESVQTLTNAKGATEQVLVPATIDILRAKEEIRVGDRLFPEPPRQLISYVPRAPSQQVSGSIVSVYGNAVALAGQNQVVVINKGLADGVETGHVFAILKQGMRVDDKSQEGERARIKLPDERNGLLMVFRPFEHLSYALILEITDTVSVGDRITNPR